MSRAWKTKQVAEKHDRLSPGGAAEIRLLPSFEQGEIVHARMAPGPPSRAATIAGTVEFFYILSGEGELWRKTANVEDVTRLIPRRCVSIPPGIEYQFRALGKPMDLLVTTAPRWRARNWRKARTRRWDGEGKVVTRSALRRGPWITVDLDLSPGKYDYLAPDGSEIRLLPTYDAGGLAHCRLPAGHASRPVRHRTVVEIWYVLAGRGDVWRSKGADNETVSVEPHRALTIPVGTSFQFRAANDSPLDIMIGTFPRWPGASEAEPVEGCWTGIPA